ncbi:PilZ domain-containing protein [Pseudomonas matsuisoli]|uniref:PilZ domain-containing protein n=1 Tax=Pseudomonas matsuisoli TaxID=1515666 RepID=A0A917UYV3_9PSED|nr:PilZ domain-containing protein [Pseudomonas matsuisoli]GGK00568.1 hypothetical protein GCM10009304_27970 [Pseudomonas matsuisoli]
MERRKHIRYSGDVLLEAVHIASGARLGRVVDLSVGGTMLFCPTLPVEESVWVCQLVPASPGTPTEAVSLTLDCLWTRPASDGIGGWAGFQIVDADDSQRIALARLIERLPTPI